MCGIYFQLLLAVEAPAPIRLTVGYTPADLLRVLIPLAVVLLLPIGLTLWMRRAALRAKGIDPAVIWFGYWRFLRAVEFGTLLVWMAAVFLLRAPDLLLFLIGSESRSLGVDLWFVLLILPPVLVITVCKVLSQPVFARVRGMEWSQSELARRSIWGLAAGFVPGFLLLAGISKIDVDPRLGVIYVGAALIFQIIVGGRGRKVLGMQLCALTVGELRDRIFALAQKAGVRVRQVYVLPAGKWRMANAFAMQGNNVLLTDYLLQHLSKREVDAIVAHELAHLQRRDPRRLWTIIVLVGAAAGVLISVLDATGAATWERLPFIAAGAVLLALLLFYFFARRFERGADAGAVALTGDPEALITALARMMRVNLLPMHWGKWDERFLTHPSTLRRVEAIAARGGISPERLQEILKATPAEVERYSLLPAVTDEERLFSTSFKSGAAVRNSWTLIAVMVLTPAVAAYLGRMAHPGGALRWMINPAGLAATLALFLAALNYIPLWGYRDLRRRFKAKLERQGITVEASGGRFAGFAPAASPRLYEGFYDWDIGFLFLQGDRLCYIGEQTQFVLRRDQVSRISLGAGGPGWWRGPRVYVTWQDAETGRGGTFNLRPGDAQSMRQLGREARGLGKQLQGWREQPLPPVTLPPPLAELRASEIGEVTSASPRALLNVRTAVVSLLLILVLAAGAGVLFELPFDALEPGSAWSVILVACVTAVFQWVPYFRYREPESAPGGRSK